MSFHSLLISINADNENIFNRYIKPEFVNKVVTEADSQLLPNPIAEDETPLIIASRVGNVEIIETLIINGAVVNFHSPKYGNTALIEASIYGRHKAMDCLIRYGARLNDVNFQQRSALLQSFVQYNDDDALPELPVTYEAIKKLIECGSNINAQDKEGKTALMLAFEVGIDDVRAIQLLLDKGIDLTLKDNLGKTYIDYLPKAHQNVQNYINSRFENAFLNDLIDYNIQETKNLNF